MTEAGLISLVIGLPVVISAITGAIVGVINTRINAGKITEAERRAAESEKKIEKLTAESEKKIEKLTADLEYTKHAAQVQAEMNRTDLILMGESMSNVRSDNAKLALVFNQLYNDFERVTGSKPPIDLQLLRDMRTIEYITGPLPHLETK